MGLELVVLGIRKLHEKEIQHLSGKTVDEMKHSRYYREVYPEEVRSARYRCLSLISAQKKDMNNIRQMLTPVQDADGNTVYVWWEEELAYYWQKNPDDDEKIDRILEEVPEAIDWNESFHIVPYEYIDVYCRKPAHPDDMETVAFLYG